MIPCFVIATLYYVCLETSIHPPNSKTATNSLFELLLWAQLVAVSALPLAAVGGTRWETSLLHISIRNLLRRHTITTYVALPADHLIAIVLRGERFERWLDDATTEAEHEMERRFL